MTPYGIIDDDRTFCWYYMKRLLSLSAMYTKSHPPKIARSTRKECQSFILSSTPFLLVHSVLHQLRKKHAAVAVIVVHATCSPSAVWHTAKDDISALSSTAVLDLSNIVTQFLSDYLYSR